METTSLSWVKETHSKEADGSFEMCRNPINTCGGSARIHREYGWVILTPVSSSACCTHSNSLVVLDVFVFFSNQKKKMCVGVNNMLTNMCRTLRWITFFYNFNMYFSQHISHNKLHYCLLLVSGHVTWMDQFSDVTRAVHGPSCCKPVVPNLFCTGRPVSAVTVYWEYHAIWKDYKCSKQNMFC